MNKDNQKIKGIMDRLTLFIEKIDLSFDNNDKEKILKALDLMLEIHIDQENRLDGTIFITHPLKIAYDIINKYKIKDRDIIISALLHDSVEDQSEILSQKYLSRNNILENYYKIIKGQDEEKIFDKIRKFALLEINECFGSNVRNMVDNLSNPNSMIRLKKDKSKNKIRFNLYKEYIKKITVNDDVCVIKYTDFSYNGLKINFIREENEKKNQLRKKYGPIIQEVFLPLFKKIDKTHPLYINKDYIIKNLEDYYKKHYLNK